MQHELYDQAQMQSWALSQVHRLQTPAAPSSSAGIVAARAQPHEQGVTRFQTASGDLGKYSVTAPAATVQTARETPGQARSRPQEASGELAQGKDVTIARRRFRIDAPLGMGSYGMVWSAKREEGGVVAIKEIICRSAPELQNAKYEGDLLEDLGKGGKGVDPRIPALAAQETETIGPSEWRVRLAMDRIPGDPLILFLEQKRLEQQPFDAPSAHKALKLLTEAQQLAKGLVVQLAPTLESIAAFAYHRDVNPRNILIADGKTAQYGLVDFGMAVDAALWAQAEEGAWRTLEVGGDCRYWPVSAWIMFLHGPQALPEDGYLCAEYRTLLDLHALGITALQVFIETSPKMPEGATEPLVRKVATLQAAWKQYWDDAHDFWSCLIDCFSNGGDWDALKRACIENDVKDYVSKDLNDCRRALAEVAAECAMLGPEAEELQQLLTAIRVMVSAGDLGEELPSWGAIYRCLGVVN